MDSLVGYGSEDENEIDRYTSHRASDSGGASGAPRRRDDDDNYDAVNMDLSEESESEPELPQAEPAPRDSRDHSRDRHDHHEHHKGAEKDNNRDRDSRDRDRDRHKSRDSDRRSPHRDDKPRSDRGREGGSRREVVGLRPDEARVPPLMDARPFGEPPPAARRSHDARDAVSPRFLERGDRREKERGDRDRERDRDREKHGRPGRDDTRLGRSDDRRPREPRAYPPPPHSGERRPTPPQPAAATSEYRPSYKVNKKLEVMEKMGLQIKTPDGSMATAQQLRATAAGEAGPAQPAGPAPSYYNAGGVHTAKILDQVQKRKLLWSKKDKSEAQQAAKWSGTRFAQDDDGKQVSKFMRLMGVKEPAAIKPEPAPEADPIKKQEELFEAMQAQYEVARATTHTMRGVGLGFQRGPF